MKLHNAPCLIDRRRALRRSLTPAEAILWKHLQRRQLDGWKFRRQHSVDAFVLDFYCPAGRLAVELDGAAHDHDTAQAHDRARDRHLGLLGIRVIRFENDAVAKNLEGVLAEIRRNLSSPLLS